METLEQKMEKERHTTSYKITMRFERVDFENYLMLANDSRARGRKSHKYQRADDVGITFLLPINLGDSNVP